MVLVVDIGNTNITFGLYATQAKGGQPEEGVLLTVFRMMSKLPRTSDEYGMALLELLRINGIDKTQVHGVSIATVVPNIMHSFLGAVRRYLELTPMVVGAGIKTGIRIVTENPKEIGPDRIVDAVAAYEKYGGPVLVIDFGTATTYDLVTGKGEFTAGITAPGLRICAKALWEDTARLPEIEIKKPKSILAQETISSMQAGLVYGQIGQTEYIIKKVQEEANLPVMKVVATGGLGRIIADETDAIEVYDSSLTLDGLFLLYQKNKRNGQVS